MTKELECKRCGMCCYLIIEGKPTNKRCPNLILFKESTFCRVFKKRIGRDIGGGNMCVMRLDSPFDYEDCPWNTGDKPLVRIGPDGLHYLEEVNKDEN